MENRDVALRSPARVVYLILSHKNPDQVRRLVGRILAGSQEGRVLVQHDDTVSRLPPEAFADQPRVTVLPSMRVEWGDWSQVEAVLRAMRWAVSHLEFDWLCFISGQDYPLQPVARTEEELADAHCDAFMQVPEKVAPFPGDWRSPGGESVRRYYYRYWRLPRRISRLLPVRLRKAAIQTILRLQPLLLLYSMPNGARLGVRRLRVPFSSGLPCWKGSEAGTYSRRCVETIATFARDNREYVKYFRRTISPSEAFIPTVVWNSSSLRVHPDYRRFIRWQASVAPDDAPRAHPDVFRVQDAPALLSARAHFGRKFDASVDARVLDLLDEHLET